MDWVSGGESGHLLNMSLLALGSFLAGFPIHLQCPDPPRLTVLKTVTRTNCPSVTLVHDHSLLLSPFFAQTKILLRVVDNIRQITSCKGDFNLSLASPSTCGKKDDDEQI